MEESIDKWSVLPKAERLRSPPVWIVKPAAGMQGEDIFMVDSYETLQHKMKTRWCAEIFIPVLVTKYNHC